MWIGMKMDNMRWVIVRSKLILTTVGYSKLLFLFLGGGLQAMQQTMPI